MTIAASWCQIGTVLPHAVHNNIISLLPRKTPGPDRVHFGPQGNRQPLGRKQRCQRPRTMCAVPSPIKTLKQAASTEPQVFLRRISHRPPRARSAARPAPGPGPGPGGGGGGGLAPSPRSHWGESFLIGFVCADGTQTVLWTIHRRPGNHNHPSAMRAALDPCCSHRFRVHY